MADGFSHFPLEAGSVVYSGSTVGLSLLTDNGNCNNAIDSFEFSQLFVPAIDTTAANLLFPQ